MKRFSKKRLCAFALFIAVLASGAQIPAHADMSSFSSSGRPDQSLIEACPEQISWRGITPYPESADPGGIYLRYSDCAYAYFHPNDAGEWTLALWSVAADNSDAFSLSFYPNCLSLHTGEDDGGFQVRWLYGSPAIALDMNQLDMERLPDRMDDALTIWDTTGWAVVANDGQALFSDASAEGDVVCTLFAGAPVCALERRAGFMRVRAATLTGWIPEPSVSTGAQMLTVGQRFPDLCVSAQSVTSQAFVYAAPNTESLKTCALNGLQQASLDRLSVIGTIDDDWVLVFSPEGINGCMQADRFSPGNG